MALAQIDPYPRSLLQLGYDEPLSEVWRVILCYGYGFNALRDGQEGAHSVGLLFQYNFEQRKHRHAKTKHAINGD